MWNFSRTGYRFLQLALIAIIYQTIPLHAVPASEKWMKDQTDQTDTLAIPLDQSEVEDQEEMKKLENMQKKYSEEKKRPVRSRYPE